MKRQNLTLYLMFLPVALYFIVFAYLPLGGLVLAFKDYNYRDGVFGSPWVGFSNFRYFFVSGKALQVTLNTLSYNALFLGAYTFCSLLVAILVAETAFKRFGRAAQSVLFLPYFISWVTVSAFMYNIFNYEYGLLNTLLTGLGLPEFDLYGDPANWRVALPVIYVWKWVGFGSVIYLAAISGIDRECYEAAEIDGANIFQRVFRITLPLLKPTIVTLILLGVGRIMRGEFDMFYQLIGNNGTLVDATDIIDTFVFRALMGIRDFGMASAAGLYQSILCFAIIVIVNRVVREIDADNALF